MLVRDKSGKWIKRGKPLEWQAILDENEQLGRKISEGTLSAANRYRWATAGEFTEWWDGMVAKLCNCDRPGGFFHDKWCRFIRELAKLADEE